MKRHYAVIDTNVLVSALLKKNSVPSIILDFISHKEIVPIINDEILGEYREVLNRPKFHFDKDVIDAVIGGMKEQALYFDGKTQDVILPDSKDQVFYEVTMEAREDIDAYLVTGNTKHFPQECFIVTPREMLDIIIKDMNIDYL